MGTIDPGSYAATRLLVRSQLSFPYFGTIDPISFAAARLLVKSQLSFLSLLSKIDPRIPEPNNQPSPLLYPSSDNASPQHRECLLLLSAQMHPRISPDQIFQCSVKPHRLVIADKLCVPAVGA
jgi:hypothetical protein